MKNIVVLLPWLVTVVNVTWAREAAFVFSADRASGQLCIASLIHSDILLTAASCQKEFLKGAYVGGKQLDGSDAQYHEVDFGAVHANYVEGQPDHNVMLVKLKTPSNGLLQEINADLNVPVDGAELQVLGFNRESETALFPQRQTMFTAFKLDRAICSKHSDISDDLIFCTSTFATCHSNMGSPVLDQHGRQVGMLVGGTECDPRIPMLNARTSTFGRFMYDGVCAISSHPFNSCHEQPPISFFQPSSPATDASSPDNTTQTTDDDMVDEDLPTEGRRLQGHRFTEGSTDRNIVGEFDETMADETTAQNIDESVAQEFDETVVGEFDGSTEVEGDALLLSAYSIGPTNSEYEIEHEGITNENNEGIEGITNEHIDAVEFDSEDISTEEATDGHIVGEFDESIDQNISSEFDETSAQNIDESVAQQLDETVVGELDGSIEAEGNALVLSGDSIVGPINTEYEIEGITNEDNEGITNEKHIDAVEIVSEDTGITNEYANVDNTHSESSPESSPFSGDDHTADYWNDDDWTDDWSEWKGDDDYWEPESDDGHHVTEEHSRSLRGLFRGFLG